MGLITGLLTLPLAPARGVVWLAEQVQGQAQRDYDERTGVQARLAGIEQARAAGEVTTAQSEALQERVLDELWAPRPAAGEGGRGGSGTGS